MNKEILLAECSKCLGCKKPICQAACPANTNVPKVIEAAKNGDYRQAMQIVGHPFGAVCGYVCPHELQCKGACVLNKKGTPVCGGIVEIQVFEQGYVPQKIDNALHGVSLAVVGVGVSGITMAELCYSHGAAVTLFEADELLHTLKSIPDFRLPRTVIANAENSLSHTNVTVKKQFVTEQDIADLSQKFDAVYLSFGATVPRKLGVVGDDFATTADEFLRSNRFGNVIVVGGGNTAMDCARLNVKRGGKSTILYRRAIAQMPAYKKEIDAAMADGVNFVCASAPVSVQKDKNNLVVTYVNTVFDGRNSLSLGTDQQSATCDVLVSAVGNALSVTIGGKRLSANENGLIFGNVYGGGDAIGGSLVATAVGNAKTAFAAILNRFGR